MDSLFSTVTNTIMTVCFGLGGVSAAFAVGFFVVGKMASSPRYTSRATSAFIGAIAGIGSGTLYPVLVNLAGRFNGGRVPSTATIAPAGLLIDYLIVTAQHGAVYVLAMLSAVGS